jgi:hypothetical protein
MDRQKSGSVEKDKARKNARVIRIIKMVRTAKPAI